MSGRNKNTSIAASFEDAKSDYAAAKSSRFRRIRTGILSSGSGADYHYRSEADYLRVLEYARDMDRSDAIIGQMLDRAVCNHIQEGLWPDPQTGNDEANKILSEKFRAWGNDPLQCDISGVQTFVDQQELVLRSTFVDGDIFGVTTDDDGLQLIEAHRCRTPNNTKRNVVHGVLLDDMRRRLEYWFTNDDIDPNMALNRVGDIEQVSAFDSQGWPNIIHVFNPKRVSQTRGVSALAPVFDVAGMFEDINFAKLVQQQVVSCFAFIRTMEAGTVREGESPRFGDQESGTYIDGAKKLIEQIAPGMELEAQPGEKVEGFTPNIPNPGAMEHFKLMLTEIGLALGMPLAMLMLDASETNFSGWRGAMDQARMGFRRNQRWLRDHFLIPVYRWKVRQWTHPATGDPRLVKLAAQLKSEGKDIFFHTWTAPKRSEERRVGKECRSRWSPYH